MELGRQLLYRGHTVRFYFECLLAAGAWFGVIAFMVVVAESMMKSRESKANRLNETGLNVARSLARERYEEEKAE